MVAYSRYPSTDTTINAIQNNIEVAFNQLDEAQFLQGQLLEDVALAASGDTKVRHSLGYQPKGYIVVKATQPEHPTYASWDNEFITLNNSSGSINTVNIWVF